MVDEPVTLPLWLLVLIGLLALLGLLDRVLVPAARWLLRRRLGRMIEGINARLAFKLPPTALSGRRGLIDGLVHDPDVLAAVDRESRETGAAREVILRRVRRYAREIVPALNVYLYFHIAAWLARRLAGNLYRVRLDRAGADEIARTGRESTVVFVMNHRSNMDYVLVSFLAAEQAALSFAAGEWARVWPLQAMVRAMGAFTVRRGSHNPLYRRVLRGYVRMATASGVTLAVFPEGNLTRDGRLRQPKLGLIDYLMRGFRPGEDRDILFVPVGINYDRVLEERLVLTMTGPRKTRQDTRRAMLRNAWFLVRNIFLVPASKRGRFGYAGVGFGRPVSLTGYLDESNAVPAGLTAEARRPLVEGLGNRLMSAIGMAIPVLPVALAASVFARQPERSFGRAELRAALAGLAERLRDTGARLDLPDEAGEATLAAALETMLRRRLVAEQAGRYRAVAERRRALDYYANSLAQLIAAG